MRATVLVVMCSVLAACTRGTPAGDQAPPPAAASAPAAAAPAGPVPAAPGVLGESLGEWTRVGAAQRFGPGNLWEYINGGAEQYLAFGFQELESAKYSHAGGLGATLDVYRMADRLRAFGIYAQESNSKRAAEVIGVEGRSGTGALEFWAGSAYVKLVVSPARPDARPLLVSLAKAVAAALGDPGSPPAELVLLPERGLVAGSVRVVPEDALGQAAFRGALEAKYQGTSGPSTLLLVPFATAGEASVAATDYATFLGQHASAPRALPTLADGGFVATERYYGQIVVVRSGRWLLISLGAASEAVAIPLLTDAATRVAAAGGIS